jgi:dynein heavy chain, axonemal
MHDGYKFSNSGLYYSPEPASLQDYLSYIESLPTNAAPEAFGLYNSVNIVSGIRELVDFKSALLPAKKKLNLTPGS